MPQRRKSFDNFKQSFPAKIPIVDDCYYSRKESAAALGLHYMTFIQAERAGLKRCYAGRLVRYRGSDLRRWLERDDD